jgi:hypothetical protein
LRAGEFVGQYGSENKMVTMFSGCRDDQTSADANIAGRSTGAMVRSSIVHYFHSVLTFPQTWAFLQIMRAGETPTYAQVSTKAYG